MTFSDDSYHKIWTVGSEHKVENEEFKIRGRAEAVLEKNVPPKLEEIIPTTSQSQIARPEMTPRLTGIYFA